MQTAPETTAFLDAFAASFADGTFIRLTLGKYRGAGEGRRCVATRVMLKDQPHVSFLTHRGRQDLTENDLGPAALERLTRLLGHDYLSAVLFTASEDLSLAYNNKKVPRLTRAKPTLAQAPPTEHNRRKSYLVDETAPYLAHLGVTHADGAARGEVKPSMYGKFRQICRFVEILDQLVAASKLKDTQSPRIVDVGSGKGYLTFALHEHFAKRLGKTPQTRGIEANATLVDTCTTIAKTCGISGLSFEATKAETQAPADLDILIALHACDTATDDAIHLGAASNAELIICAPCCQHEIAPQLETRHTPLAGLVKYGLLRQRQADLFTDAARALVLETRGYEVRMIEFVSTEHTAKNLMIAAVKSSSVDRKAAAEQYRQLAALAGFQHHRLHDLMEPATTEGLIRAS